MKKHFTLILALAGALSFLGCGDPSIEDVCGSCSGAGRRACELAYDQCKDTKGCDLDDLEDAYKGICALGDFLTEGDAGS